jgi:hypothetical protein
MKKILLFTMCLQICNILFLRSYSQSISSTNDTSTIRCDPVKQINSSCGRSEETISVSCLPIKNEMFPLDLENVCGYITDNKISFLTFGIQDVPSPDVLVSNPGMEVSICVDPNNKESVRICNMPNNNNDPIDCYYSSDKGIHWNNYSTFSFSSRADPISVISVNGTNHWWFSYLMNGDGCEVYVEDAEYDDSFQNWLGHEDVGVPADQSHWFDKPFLNVDNTLSSPYFGNFYCAWTTYVCDQYPTLQTDDQIEITNKVGENGSWSPNYITLSDPYIYGSHQSINSGVNIQIGTGGEVYVVWQIAKDNPPATAIGFTRSTDGGSNYIHPIKIQDIHGIGDQDRNYNPNWWPFHPKVNSFPSMCVDKSRGPHNGRIYVVWNAQYYDNGVPVDRTDIYIVWSDSQGDANSWQGPYRVNQSNIYSGGSLMTYHAIVNGK